MQKGRKSLSGRIWHTGNKRTEAPWRLRPRKIERCPQKSPYTTYIPLDASRHWIARIQLPFHSLRWRAAPGPGGAWNQQPISIAGHWLSGNVCGWKNCDRKTVSGKYTVSGEIRTYTCLWYLWLWCQSLIFSSVLDNSREYCDLLIPTLPGTLIRASLLKNTQRITHGESHLLKQPLKLPGR